MNVVPLATHSNRALRETLLAHGWEVEPADAAASGGEPVALHLTGLDDAALEALVRYAGRLGLEVHTGDGWAVLAGPRWRLGTFARLDAARAQADRLAEAGARVIDVGGESTRPGREAGVPEDEELARVLPVVRAVLADHPGIVVSIDTVKSAVARVALAEGAGAINDVAAFRLDPAMAAVAAAAGAGVVLMHSRGTITEIASYRHAEYHGDVAGAVIAELRESIAAAVAQGVAPEAIVVDPGLGFSKTPEQSAYLCDQLAALRALGRPILVGPSRKRFVGAIAGGVEPAAERDRATAVVCALAWERGARLFRVHDVGATREALAVVRGIAG